MYSEDKHPDDTNARKNNVQRYRVKVHNRQLCVQEVETVAVKYSESDKHRHSMDNIHPWAWICPPRPSTEHYIMWVTLMYIAALASD